MSIRLLSPELQKKSETELNEVPHRIQEDLKQIRDWLVKQPHLTARTDDQWLLTFLRGCKFSLQRTKEKLDMFYTMRTMLPEFFSNRDPLLPDIQDVLKLGLLLPLPKIQNSAEPRIILSRCEPADPSKIPFMSVVKTSIMIIDILLNEDDNFIIAGQQALIDLKGVNLNHIVQVTPSICKKCTICLQNAYPTRPKNIDLINMPSIFETVFNLMKSLTTEKIKNRINACSVKDLDGLYKKIPRPVLPKEYGGDGCSLEELTVTWRKKVESYRDWFLEDAKYCSNEKIRPGKPRNADEMFGVEGSFRKLDID